MRNYFKKSFSTGMLNVGGSALISAIFIPLIVQKLGLELYGKWTMVLIFSGFSNIADMGVSKAMVYLIPKHKEQKDINEIYSAGLIINNMLVLILGTICIAVYFSGINVWNTDKAISNELGNKLFIVGCFIACCSLATQFYRSIIEAFYKIYFVNIGFLLLTILNYIPIYLLSLHTKDVSYFIYSTALMYIVVLFFHILVFKLTCSVNFNIPHITIYKKIISSSAKFFSIGLLIGAVLPINRYLLIYISDDTQTYGAFDIALKIAMMANSFLSLFATPLLSIFSGYGKERLGEIKAILNRSLIWLGSAYLIGCSVFYIYGKNILQLLFKVETGDVFIATLVLIMGICLTGVSEPFYRAFLGLGTLRVPFGIKIVLVILNFIIILILFHFPPLYRIAFAIAISYGFTSILTVAIFRIRYL